MVWDKLLFQNGRSEWLLLGLTLAPTLQLPVLPVLPLTTPVNLASNNSCLLGSRLWSSSIAPRRKYIYKFVTFPNICSGTFHKQAKHTTGLRKRRICTLNLTMTHHLLPNNQSTQGITKMLWQVLHIRIALSILVENENLLEAWKRHRACSMQYANPAIIYRLKTSWQEQSRFQHKTSQFCNIFRSTLVFCIF